VARAYFTCRCRRWPWHKSGNKQPCQPQVFTELQPEALQLMPKIRSCLSAFPFYGCPFFALSLLSIFLTSPQKELRYANYIPTHILTPHHFGLFIFSISTWRSLCYCYSHIIAFVPTHHDVYKPNIACRHVQCIHQAWQILHARFLLDTI